MSTYANPDKAYVWLDGDAYRAPAGSAKPSNPLEAAPLIAGAPMLAFGGIEAGFEITPTRDFKKLDVWNRRSAPYKAFKGPKSQRVKLRFVDYSPATVLTMLQGGSITETDVDSGVFEWTVGDDEEFAILLHVRDGDDVEAFWSDRVTLVNDPSRPMGGDKLDGFEVELEALSPFVPLTNWNPLAVGGITVAPSAFTLATTTGTKQLKAFDSNGVDVTTTATWSSSVPAKATVGASTGLVTGVAAGSTVITATYQTFTDTCAITVP
jgi:uncharacterized protein YjdB